MRNYLPWQRNKEGFLILLLLLVPFYFMFNKEFFLDRSWFF